MQTFMRVVTLVITLLATSSAWAQTPTYLGPGAAPCSNWLKERLVNSRMSLIMHGWVLGYLSGGSVLKQPTGEDAPDSLRGVGEDAIFGWMDNYCSKHPSDELVHATVQLQVMLRQKAKAR
jgi:hypothetical protein